MFRLLGPPIVRPLHGRQILAFPSLLAGDVSQGFEGVLPNRFAKSEPIYWDGDLPLPPHSKRYDGACAPFTPQPSYSGYEP